MELFHQLFTGRTDVVAGMSYRANGDMRICATDDTVQDNVLARRLAYLGGMTPPLRFVAAPLPVHGVDVMVVTGTETMRNSHALFPDADALVTAAPGVALTVTAADCLPVLFVDPVRRIIGIAHAGWRGLAAPEGGVLAATVAAMVGLGVSPAHLQVAIGPSIGPCHYAVDAERRALFTARFGDEIVVGDALDLRRAAVVALTRCGIHPAHSAADPPCTTCDPDRFFSYRASGGADGDFPQTGMAWIALS